MFDKKGGFWIFWALLIATACCNLSFLPPETNYVFPFDNYHLLSGTFGELRGNHFHSGIDVKTHRKTGIPIRAASDGYVYRLKTSAYGFGKAVYLKHTDGNFSVYAHCDRFIDAYEKFVQERQKKEEQYEQEIYLQPETFLVKAGQVIAYSGNSGSSIGPHLHFEIRDKHEKIMNPLAYYPGKVKDNIRPLIQEIAFEPLSEDARIEGSWDKLRLTPTKLSTGNYQIKDIIHLKGEAGIEYQAYDLLNGAPNHCGINYARLYLDEKLIHELSLDTFSFDETHHINMHIDFAYYKEERSRLQRAFIKKGNDFSAYRPLQNRGVIKLDDLEPHKFRLELEDFAGNKSTVSGTLVQDRREASLPQLPSSAQTRLRSEEKHSILKITASNPTEDCKEGLLVENIFGKKTLLKPAYYADRELVYLLPLDRYNYPERISSPDGKENLQFSYYEEILPDQNNLVELDELQLFFPFESIFDNLHLQIAQEPRQQGMYSDIFEVGNPNIPIKESYLISFKVPEKMDRSKMVVAEWDRDEWKYAGSVMGSDKNVYASMNSFGKFCLMQDKTQPTIRSINFTDGASISSNQRQLTLGIDDDFSGIDHLEIFGTLDGEWVPLEYFFRQDKIRLDLTDHRPESGLHQFKVRVKDRVGNMAEKSFELRF
jgi:hypothetical protein